MPGVQITTAVRTGPAVTGTAPDSTFFVVGQTERGKDNVAQLVTSIDEYESFFGGYEANKYTHSTVRTFFEEGGANCYVSRAVKSTWVKASRDLFIAGEDATHGVRLTAAGAGTWGNDLKVEVLIVSSLMNVTISYGSETNVIFAASGLAHLNDLVDAINNDTVAPYYCTAALLAGSDGDTEVLIATGSAVSFTSGAQTGSIANSDYITALEAFTEELGGGCVAVPGVATGTLVDADEDIYDALKSHAKEFNRIAICSFANGKTAAEVRSTSNSYGSGDNSDHEYMAFFYPWVTIPSGSGVTLTIPPEGYVAAVRSKAHNSTGPWKAYAGVDSNARFVTGIATAIGKTTGDELDAARVNAIRVLSNDVRVYGARSHSTTTAQWRFITAREVINYVVNQANIALEPLIFSTIDGRKTIYADVTAALQSVLEPVRIAGGLYEGFSPNGKRVDYGYTIKVDDTLNPPSQLESGLVKAQVGIRVSTIGDKVTVNIIKSNLTTALV